MMLLTPEHSMQIQNSIGKIVDDVPFIWLAGGYFT
jgi:hypothetical protein